MNKAASPLAQKLIEKAGLLSNAQAAGYLDISPTTLNIWRCKNSYRIPYTKVGGRVRYRKEDLDAWLASRTVGGVEA